MLFAYHQPGSAARFYDGLAAGDPAAWCILAGIILASAISAWRKYNTFSS